MFSKNKSTKTHSQYENEFFSIAFLSSIRKLLKKIEKEGVEEIEKMFFFKWQNEVNSPSVGRALHRFRLKISSCFVEI